jgi:hypothetical protein
MKENSVLKAIISSLIFFCSINAAAYSARANSPAWQQATSAQANEDLKAIGSSVLCVHTDLVENSAQAINTIVRQIPTRFTMSAPSVADNANVCVTLTHIR